MNLALLHDLLHRPENANKYDFGHVLIFGGSPGMVGAPLLSGKAALRIGAGLVTIASDQMTAARLDRRVEEIMTLALPSYNSPTKVVETLITFVRDRKVRAVVVGPGLKAEASPIVRSFVGQAGLPTVLDAGGLSAFYGQLPQLREATRSNPNIIITPHTGEYAKLSGAALTERDALAEQAVQFAKNYALTLVLKGHHTHVIHPSGSSYENLTGNPGLATAGTGDVLSGAIAGLLAQGLAVDQATEVGVYLHGLAGDLAARAKNQAGLIASDVIDSLPLALKKAARLSV